MANKKLKWLESAKVDKVLSLCDWLLLLGERSNGKSYASKNLLIKKCIDNDEELIYLRRYNLDVKDSLCVSYFGDCPVDIMTNGEYSCIDVYRKGIWLANIDEESGKVKRGKKIGYCHALSASEHYKSLAFPKVGYIIFEEVISIDGRYLFNEPNKLQQYVSTIFRNHKGKVVLIGNTISRICPYYREWDLKGVAKQKLGSVEDYIFHNDNGEDTTLSVFLTDSLNYNSGMFFGLASKNITKGAYEVQKQPHLPKNVTQYKILYQLVFEYNEFRFLCQLLQDKEKSDNVFWYVQPKTSEIKENTRVISNKFSVNPLYSIGFNRPLNENERRVFEMFNRGKVCYSDNLTGTEFDNCMKLSNGRRG